MSNWTARLKSEITKKALESTAITDKSHLSSVSSVGVCALFENTQLASDLIEAAMRRCDEFNDDESARQQMRDDCLSLSPAMQADLLAHFKESPKGTPPNDQFFTEIL